MTELKNVERLTDLLTYIVESENKIGEIEKTGGHPLQNLLDTETWRFAVRALLSYDKGVPNATGTLRFRAWYWSSVDILYVDVIGDGSHWFPLTTGLIRDAVDSHGFQRRFT